MLNYSVNRPLLWRFINSVKVPLKQIGVRASIYILRCSNNSTGVLNGPDKRPIFTSSMALLEKSEYAVTPFKLNEMPKINEISHFAHIDYQAFAINDCAACF